MNCVSLLTINPYKFELIQKYWITQKNQIDNGVYTFISIDITLEEIDNKASILELT